MNATLFLLCPSDCLESTIDKEFIGKHHFYTSLANTLRYDLETLEAIKKVIQSNDISEIFLVLSADNKIILDALERQDFSEIRGLKKMYNNIKIQKSESELFWQTNDPTCTVISYYLNQKKKQLQYSLNSILNQSITVSGKIYIKTENNFVDIYPNTLCLEKQHLN